MTALLFMYSPITDGGCNELIGMFDDEPTAIVYANDHQTDEPILYCDVLITNPVGGKTNDHSFTARVNHWRRREGEQFSFVSTGSVKDYTQRSSDAGDACPY